MAVRIYLSNSYDEREKSTEIGFCSESRLEAAKKLLDTHFIYSYYSYLKPLQEITSSGYGLVLEEVDLEMFNIQSVGTLDELMTKKRNSFNMAEWGEKRNKLNFVRGFKITTENLERTIREFKANNNPNAVPFQRVLDEFTELFQTYQTDGIIWAVKWENAILPVKAVTLEEAEGKTKAHLEEKGLKVNEVKGSEPTDEFLKWIEEFQVPVI